MNTVIQSLNLFFENRKKFSDFIMENRNFTLGFTGYFAGSLSVFIWQYLGGKTVGSIKFVLILFTAFSFNIILGIIFSAIINLFMEVTKSKGNFSGTFILLGMCDFVKVLLIPISLILYKLGYLNTFGWFFIFIIGIIQFILIINLLKNAYHCSVFKAVMAYSIPFSGAIFMLFIFVIATAMELLKIFQI